MPYHRRIDPVGFGIGPGLECIEVLAALSPDGSKEKTGILGGGQEVLDKGTQMAGSILEMLGKAQPGKGVEIALDMVKKGKALDKMREIIEAQGGDPKVKISDLPVGKYLYSVKAEVGGRVAHVDNRLVSRIARAAGAPKDKGAGMILHCEMGDKVNVGDTLFEIISESETKLSFAIETATALPPIELQKVILGKVE